LKLESSPGPITLELVAGAAVVVLFSWAATGPAASDIAIDTSTNPYRTLNLRPNPAPSFPRGLLARLARRFKREQA
jgi:hypothetical protein